MKRILHVLAQRPGRTGSGIFLESIITEAGKKGYSQAVIAGIPDKDKIYFRPIKKENTFPVFFETTKLPFPVVGMSDVMPYKSTKYRNLTDEMYDCWRKSFQKTLLNAVTKFKPDLIISHHLWLLSCLVKKIFTDIPLIAICHGTGLRQMKLAPVFANNVINECKKIDLVLALTKHQKREIIRNYRIENKIIKVIGGGYNPDVFYPPGKKRKSNKIKLVYVGKLSFAKGVLSLLRTYNRIQMDNLKLSLNLVGSGSGDEEQSIRNYAKKCLSPVEFTGAVSQAHLADIFRRSDIFILPSFYEGLGLVVIEALASGLRVITTDLPGLKEWISDKINKKGIIEYVKLPGLINTDCPLEQDLPEFEHLLKKAIEKQIKKLHTGQKDTDADISEFLKDKSWEGVFSKIETHFDAI